MPTRPEHETPRIALIREHYRNLEDDLRWSLSRVRRLCEALQLTIPELASFILVPPSVFERHVFAERLPATVRLHLLLIERSVFASTQPPVFPALP